MRVSERTAVIGQARVPLPLPGCNTFGLKDLNFLALLSTTVSSFARPPGITLFIRPWS
jgi:hypothetical protein